MRSSELGVAGTNMVASLGLYQDVLVTSFLLSLSSLFHFQGLYSSVIPVSSHSTCFL